MQAICLTVLKEVYELTTKMSDVIMRHYETPEENIKNRQEENLRKCITRKQVI